LGCVRIESTALRERWIKYQPANPPSADELEMPMYLTKSDFKVARTCGTKLFYRKMGYPSNLSDSEYLNFLADGGYMVEVLARACFPDGREMPFDSVDLGLSETQTAMGDCEVTLFEPSFLAGQLLARFDILEKRGEVLRIIEVKAKSFTSNESPGVFRGVNGKIKAEWRPYLEDVTFQTLVLRRLYPEATVIPCLCLVDKSASCESDSLFRQFSVSTTGPRGRPKVTFHGDRQSLQNSPLVKILDVSQEVAELLREVEQTADEFARTLGSQAAERISPQLGHHCKNCEFRFPLDKESERHGFRECWGDLANHEHHLLDLYRVDLLENTGEVTRLINAGSTSLMDVRHETLLGTTGVRQKIQLENTRRGREYISSQLPLLLRDCRYPLHFVDFEASRPAVPYHAGMHPYEQVLFQWSCHTIAEPGASLIHCDWINVDDVYPNFVFTRTLREALSEVGTVFVWSHFEKSALKDARKQLARYGQRDLDLEKWLNFLTADNGPIVDLCKLAKEHYFHPQMKGSLSIKQVLPAVWSSSAELRRHQWFSDYQREENGRHLAPYQALPNMSLDGHEEIDVREGTAAIRTYQEMMYGARSYDAHFRDAQRQALRNYCKLDTAAMVMIWLRWTGQV
jgi:hypothetical protein